MELADSYIKRYKRITDPIVDEFLQKQKKQASEIDPIAANLVERMSEILIGGKRVRGALMCLGYELLGGRKKEIYKTSLFLELFHSGLLIHDDVIDRDEKRRGVSTIHFLFGDPMAINAGDLVFSWTLSYLFSSPFPADRLVSLAELFGGYFTKTIYGQILDISKKSSLETTRLKTAEYTGVFPLLAGAIIAGEENKRVLDALSDYGRNLGMIFQIHDDILDGNGEPHLVKLQDEYYQKGLGFVPLIAKIEKLQNLLRSFLVFAKSWKS